MRKLLRNKISGTFNALFIDMCLVVIQDGGVDHLVRSGRYSFSGAEMSNITNITSLNDGCKAVGAQEALPENKTSVADDQHSCALLISDIAKAKCIQIATNCNNLSQVKHRIMYLYEKQIITAGDVERLFDVYKLRDA